MNYGKIAALGKTVGFERVAPLEPGTIILKPEVREMCRACSQFGRRWSCPPYCGALEECAARIGEYRSGILVQTVGALEDEWDGEGMMDLEATHKRRFRQMRSLLREEYPLLLSLGAGCCNHCAVCTCPDGPCRFPEERISSMEAYGMLVQEVCRENDLPYYYGPRTLAYTGCFLID